VKLVVEEPESAALLAALDGNGPFVTSVVGEIETVRACRRASVPAAQVEQLRNALVLIALDHDAQVLASTIAPATLRTLDAIHLATAVSLGEELESMITYDTRLARAAAAAGVQSLAPT
jgi:predicted nucleic acid-binding protein